MFLHLLLISCIGLTLTTSIGDPSSIPSHIDDSNHGHSDDNVLGQCGHPGVPLGSDIVTNITDKYVWLEGEEVTYKCQNGWVRLGGELGLDSLTESVKKCLSDGSWSDISLVCWENLAINQPSLQSGTFLDNFSQLAVDGDINTCSYTLAQQDQRWWQVQIRSSHVDTIMVMTRAPSSVMSVSVFVIELLPGSKAEYKQCKPIRHNQNGYTVFDCNKVKGEFVYIRDDRFTEEHLGICEVVVIPTSDPLSCGIPAGPVNGSVIISESRTKASFDCKKGLTLVGQSEATCQDGEWFGLNGSTVKTPSCIAMKCSVPESPEHGRVQTSIKTFKFGATVIVLCDEGYVLSGNNTRQCVEGGQWTGPPPSCTPILCQNPPAVVNGVVELMNGTTLWQAAASYQCLPGFYNYGYENTSVVYSVCQQNGTWSTVSLTCMAEQTYSEDGDIPWRGKQEADSSTIIAITVLSVIISAIIFIIIVSIFVKKRKESIENSRKISTSSTNQLLYNQINSSSHKSVENNNDYNYDKWKITHEKDYSLLQKTASNDSAYLEDHIYSTLKKQNKTNERRDSIENEDDDDVYATVNFKGNSIAVISDYSDTHHLKQEPSQGPLTNDINDLYAKIDVNKKRNRK